MPFHAARILKADDGFGNFQVANIENVDVLPADYSKNGRDFTYRQINELNVDETGSYRWPVGPGYSVTLHDDPTLCQYFTPEGDAVALQFVPAE
jgi:hypothetical protein